ncbi:GNAT family N-acetyltransferase [Planomonospora venezuelensis]|uniref:Diamine N-acetyltransferase n=1 Tax=Planomonospora venezuelensis TaxID=1999 RepID=A0A841DA48_PLAVE|nr:GNAT family N-acetyltransferase [Planomonospora venezuelensis]MBB5965005.1 diamine N-acetyltransferase [Planomonospora venezuelensis]GIN05438.1 N-acetyltransferase [Planomonospora venezuelensis]
MTASLRLEKVTPENVRAACDMRLRPGQERFVAPVAQSLAEAYVQPDVAWPRLVFDGDRLVGFVMLFLDVPLNPDDPQDPPRSGLWRLAVAADEQGRGYGRFAVEAVCEELRRRGKTRVTVTWVPGDGGPEPFYLKLGFRPTGEKSDDEIVAERDL